MAADAPGRTGPRRRPLGLRFRRPMASAARILLVDDEASIQKLLSYPLQKDGYEVVRAADGREALARFAEQAFDLVILDVMLPHVDGLEVCKQLRARSAVPIIMLSARSEEIDKATNTLQKIHLAVRGLYGEGTEVMGNFFQVSNQATLGRSEMEILESLERVTRQSGRLPKKTPAYGSWLLGRRVETAGRRRVRIQVILTVFISVINVVGIAVAALLVLVAFPEPDIFEDAPLRYGVVIMPVYVISALAVGTWLLTDTTVNALRWATERRRPTVDDQRSTFMIPWRVAVVHIALWGGAAVLSTVLFGRVEDDLKLKKLEDAARYRIGSYQGDAIVQYLQERGFLVDVAINDRLNPAKLAARRIDLWGTGRLIGQYILRQEKMIGIQPVLTFNRTEMYLACNKAMQEKRVEQFNTLLHAMEKDGTINQIYSQYGYQR